MTGKIKKFFNLKIIIIIVCIITFILANSAQQKYTNLDDVPISTLITTSTIPPETTTTQPPTPTQTGPTFPTDTPSQPNGGGIDNGREAFIPTQIIPIVISVLFLILIGLLIWRRKKEMQTVQQQTQYISGVARSRREKLVTKIKTLVEILNDYLKQGKFSEGIIYGFHQLDSNMKRILGVSRDSHLTPKEFSNSLELPEVIPHLDWLVNAFYLARYKLAKMEYQDLESFIQNLQKIKNLSVSGSDIEILEKKQLSDKK
ncbi:MAG: hypothetical protein ACFFDS_00730 [Candidatus Thorarchaeota archaeon]